VASLALKRLVLRLAGTSAGRRAIQLAIRNDPSVAMEPLGQTFNRPATFRRVDAWPDTVRGFEDLAFLFSSSTLNNGIADLAFDEAAYLFRLVRNLRGATIVEIGRFKGGSTFVIAAAMDESSELWTYDIHVKLSDTYDGHELDADLEAALRRYGLDGRVHVVVADSRIVTPPGSCALVFVDGDHRYEGVRADYEHWRPAIVPGGHLLFHDAGATRAFAPEYPDVARLVAEIDADDSEFERVGAAGSLVHFRRAGVS
jgi:predicted O-methyltransferase YrrM